MLAQILTACSIVACSIAAVCAFVAIRSANQATSEAESLRLQRGRIAALEHSAEALHSRLQSLTGKFYAMKRWHEVETMVDDEPDPRPDNAPPALTRDELRRQHLRPIGAVQGE